MKVIGWKGFWLFSTVVVWIAGCSSDPNPSTSEGKTSGESVQVDAAQAKETYQSNCMSCHGDQLQGAQGPSLEKVGAKFSSKEIETIIQRGRGSMPAQVSLNPEERKNLAGWLAEKK
ncbi:c-type cytochrome [Kroppenstedtia eburnea]|uniref:Cytochrome c551 n=1 Tax=Kroppenstedtia eburnea TaxID=714067 RepID=A0A1N7MH75_9BACL|nr:cytochrome c [Kroppenstedtia eburnea]EGK07096.1 cytochrome c-551 [Desmospora sp. 8437]QKI81571.1 cytochrome c [Kroppenstedtia eburnea]SIS85455.1 cytochrome c551 [Kroppenstedtia eburnea]